jgi:hypothetical protein
VAECTYGGDRGELQRPHNPYPGTAVPGWHLAAFRFRFTALVFAPKGLTEPGLLPGGATPHGVLENLLGSAVPAFIVTALVSGKAGVRDLTRRSGERSFAMPQQGLNT